MAWINADGTPVECGHCVTPDHFLSTFTITVRSMNHVSAEMVKELVQKKFEVVKAELAALDVVVVPCPTVPTPTQPIINPPVNVQ